MAKKKSKKGKQATSDDPKPAGQIKESVDREKKSNTPSTPTFSKYRGIVVASLVCMIAVAIAVFTSTTTITSTPQIKVVYEEPIFLDPKSESSEREFENFSDVGVKEEDRRQKEKDDNGGVINAPAEDDQDVHGVPRIEEEETQKNLNDDETDDISHPNGDEITDSGDSVVEEKDRRSDIGIEVSSDKLKDAMEGLDSLETKVEVKKKEEEKEEEGTEKETPEEVKQVLEFPLNKNKKEILGSVQEHEKRNYEKEFKEKAVDIPEDNKKMLQPKDEDGTVKLDKNVNQVTPKNVVAVEQVDTTNGNGSLFNIENNATSKIPNISESATESEVSEDVIKTEDTAEQKENDKSFDKPTVSLAAVDKLADQNLAVIVDKPETHSSGVKKLELTLPATDSEPRTKKHKSSDANYIKVTDGVTKMVLDKGSGSLPRPGDVISMHCVGYLDENPPVQFWSTRELGQRIFSFAVGKKQVIKGWDEGAASMKLREKSRLKIEAKKAYGVFGFEAWGTQLRHYPRTRSGEH